MRSRGQPSLFLVGVAAALCLCVGALLAAWNPKDEKAPSAASPPSQEASTQIGVKHGEIRVSPIQVDVNMVVVNVTVTDPFDRIVTGLDQSNFQVFDEKVSQEIVSFST